MRNFSILCVLFCLVGCNSAKQQEKSGRLSVFVSIAPEKFLVEQITQGTADVEVLVPPGREPHDYNPSAKQMAELGNSSVLFTIGVPFEQTLVPKLKNMFPELRIVDIAGGIKRRYFACYVNEHVGHDHEHEYEGADPHVWMSPANMIVMADNVCNELCTLDPADAEKYRAATEKLKQRLSELQKNIARQLAPCRGKTFYVFHPTMGYFADEFGLHQRAIEVEGKEPTARQLAELISQAKAEDVHVIFVQPQFPQRAAKSVAHAIDGVVECMDPLSEKYVENLEKITAALKTALEKEHESN